MKNLIKGLIVLAMIGCGSDDGADGISITNEFIIEGSGQLCQDGVSCRITSGMITNFSDGSKYITLNSTLYIDIYSDYNVTSYSFFITRDTEWLLQPIGLVFRNNNWVALWLSYEYSGKLRLVADRNDSGEVDQEDEVLTILNTKEFKPSTDRELPL